MKIAEFINRCDSVGGLDKMFACGYTENDIEINEKDANEVALRMIIWSAREAWDKFDTLRDIYYSSVERGIY